MITRKQHYIPQFLIKKFAEDDGSLSLFLLKENKLLTEQNPRNFAQIKDMYNIKKEDLIEMLRYIEIIDPNAFNRIDFNDPIFVEKYFSRVEYNASKLINRILHHDQLILSLSDKLVLFLFLHDLAYRTKFYRDVRFSITQKSNEIISDIARANNFSDEQKEDNLLENSNIVELSSIFSLSSYIKFISMLYENYDICYAKNDTDQDFILSDNPTFMITCGLNDFCFPISRKRAIVFRIKKTRSLMICSIPNYTFLMNLSERNVHEYNIYNASYSHEIIFGTKKSLFFLRDKVEFKSFEIN